MLGSRFLPPGRIISLAKASGFQEGGFPIPPSSHDFMTIKPVKQI